MLVTLKQGIVKGAELKSVFTKKSLFGFLGIPYAKPPINVLRFQAPQPHDGWSGIFDASKNGSQCLQRDSFTSFVGGEEDCLYINVYTTEPPENTTELKPVMCYVHGGGFQEGHGGSALHSPDFLMEHDIIFVSFNYRLNIFGFLNLGLPECPGNVGLRDQILALKWIQDNIKSFGGDPNNVTAFGISAGAASIHYLMASPLCKGLFHKVILQSGSALCPWGLVDNPSECAFMVGSILGCNTTDRMELLNFLLEVPAMQLLAAIRLASQKFRKDDRLVTVSFVPSVESKIAGIDAILPDQMDVLFQNLQPLPVIIGQSEFEGAILLNHCPLSVLYNYDKKINIIPSSIRKIVGYDQNIVRKIKQFYVGDKEFSEETLPKIVDIMSDTSFAFPFYKTLTNILRRSMDTPVYVYKFCYEGNLNLVRKMLIRRIPQLEHLKGSFHADDGFYIFCPKLLYEGLEYGEKELNVIRNLCTLWTNFAKNKSLKLDEIEWEPTSLEKQKYLNISDKVQMVNGLMNEGRLSFWNNLENEIQSKNALCVKL